MTEHLLFLAGCVLCWGGIALRAGGLIGSKRYWLSQWSGDVFWLRWKAADGGIVWAVYFGIAAASSYVMWRWADDDDDDDRRRRLLAWGRSKIPKPTVVRLRPVLEDR